MKRDPLLLAVGLLTLAELTLLLLISYRYFQAVQPEITALQNTGSGIGGLINLITGKSGGTTTTTKTGP